MRAYFTHKLPIFQSTRPIRGTTGDAGPMRPVRRDFNPRAPYGARQARGQGPGSQGQISIHAPHTGRDLVSTHACTPLREFQSTRPIRGATYHSLPKWHSKQRNFNPRAPYGARPIRLESRRLPMVFQSTRPIRGATESGTLSLSLANISIHAPHTGRDRSRPASVLDPPTFQSTRPIRGATFYSIFSLHYCIHFNPRAPYGARPDSGSRIHFCGGISIHAPHTGRD